MRIIWCPSPSPKVVSSPSHCRHLHHFFKTIFTQSSMRNAFTTKNVPAQLYTHCFLCPFSISPESTCSLAGHFYNEHIQPCFKRYAERSATKLEVLMLFHYACVQNVPTPRLPGYDAMQVMKERNQFYFRHRSYKRGRDIVRPCAKKFAAIAAHVDTLAAREESWAAEKERSRAVAKQAIAAMEELLKRGYDTRTAIAMRMQFVSGGYPSPTALCL